MRRVAERADQEPAGVGLRFARHGCRVSPAAESLCTERPIRAALRRGQLRYKKGGDLRYVGGVERDLIHVELLRALASRPEAARNSAELAETMVKSRQFVAAKLRPLVSAGLVSRRWGSAQADGRTYKISDEGRAYLMRIDSKLADRA
jgi:hypothetical protein